VFCSAVGSALVACQVYSLREPRESCVELFIAIAAAEVSLRSQHVFVYVVSCQRVIGWASSLVRHLA